MSSTVLKILNQFLTMTAAIKIAGLQCNIDLLQHEMQDCVRQFLDFSIAFDCIH